MARIQMRRPRPDWRAVLMGSVASLVVLPPLQLVPSSAFAIAMVAAPMVGSAVAGVHTRNFGDEFLDGIVAAWGSLLALLVGMVATMLLLGYGGSVVFVGGFVYLFGILVVGFPAGGIVGAVVGHVVGRLSPSVEEFPVPA